MDSRKRLIATGAILGAIAVILGAMGAHMLKSILDESSLESFNTGVRYQMYHALFLLVLAAINVSNTKYIYWLTLVGTVFFSGSIYLLNLAPIYDMNMRFLGPVTPLGGLMLISAWTILAVNVLRSKSD